MEESIKSRVLMDIEQTPGYKYQPGFIGVRSVTEGKVFNQYFPLAPGEYPACKIHGAILLVAKRQDGGIWRCREIGCEEGCFCPKQDEI